MPLSVQESRDLDERFAQAERRLIKIESALQTLIDQVSILIDNPAERQAIVSDLVTELVKAINDG